MERLPGTPYLAGEVMGRGPHGAVFTAQDAAERRLAVKVLTPDLSGGDASAREFAGQRDTLTSLRHPHLMPVYDIVLTDTGLLAVVSERAEGGNLRQALEVVRTFPPSEACRLGAQIARALASLHATGLVHGDLTSTNILFNDSGSRPAVRVSDAGLTRWLAGLGRGWIPVGAAAYAAPEVAAGGVPGASADLYALGVLLHEMCVGVPPFTGDPADVTRRHVEEVPVRPAGIPDQLWVLIAALLAKDGAARVGPAAAVAGYLDAIAADVDRVPPAAPIGPIAAAVPLAPLPDISAPGSAWVDEPIGDVSPTAETDVLPVVEPPAWTPPPADPAPWERPPVEPAAYDPYPSSGSYGESGGYDAGAYDAGAYAAAAGYGAGGYGGAGYGPVGSDPVEVAAAADAEEERARNAAYLAMYERDRRRRFAIIAAVVLLSVIGVGVAIGAVLGGGDGDDDPGTDDPGIVLPTPGFPGDLEETPTPTPEESPTPTPEESPTPTPTPLAPGTTPTPTPEPTPTPTPTPVPTPTPTIPVVTVTPPDPTPTPTPTPTEEPTPTPTPTLTPEPTPPAVELEQGE
ncbi:hypothetical protein GCM10009547_41040 [Sporichthya brevicatena]|uniref:non-specific serine/threonine protein kinase n=1 Tax=Sporichthya brevicatena TaxID=171442 RepID=A0ABN1H8S8_9ACTN